MARVLFSTATLAKGGGIAQVARLSVQLLREAGHQVTVLRYLDAHAGPGEIAAHGSRLRFAAALHWHAPRADLCFYDSAGIARAHPFWLAGKPTIIWMHGAESWEALRPAAQSTLRRASRVLVVSQSSLSRFEGLHGALANARICPLATETDIPVAREAAPDEASPTVLIVGRVDGAENYKGHDALLAAWPDVVAAVPAARLMIVGGGSGVPALCAHVAQSPVAANIELRGFVDALLLAQAWRDAAVFAMPSRGEGFGLVYIEAMRHGLPVIASVHDAGREVNLDGQTGFNVDLDTPGELAARLIALLSNPALRGRMGAAGQARWHDHYRLSCLRSRFLPLVEALLPR